MYQLNALIVISLFLSAFLLLAWLICEFGATAQADDSFTAGAVLKAEGLRFNGMLYLRNSDKPVEAWLHTGTGKGYYKIGIQYRDAMTGRIVSYAAATQGL